MPKPLHEPWSKGNPLNPGFLYYSGVYVYSGFHHLPLESLQAWGQIGHSTVFQRLYSKSIAYKYDYSHVRGKNRAKKPQGIQLYYFNKFKNGVAMWKALSQDKKDYYEQRAKVSGKPWWGLSYYLHHYMLNTGEIF